MAITVFSNMDALRDLPHAVGALNSFISMVAYAENLYQIDVEKEMSRKVTTKSKTSFLNRLVLIVFRKST